MTQKERLYQFLSDNSKDLTLRKLNKFAREEYHSLRVKEVGSQGDVLISLSDKDGWISPTQWMNNYKLSRIDRLEQEMKGLSKVVPQDELLRILHCDEQFATAKQASRVDVIQVPRVFSQDEIESLIISRMRKLKQATGKLNMPMVYAESVAEITNIDARRLYTVIGNEFNRLNR